MPPDPSTLLLIALYTLAIVMVGLLAALALHVATRAVKRRQERHALDRTLEDLKERVR
jgi:type II secretory pathway pseudopilin PulG